MTTDEILTPWHWITLPDDKRNAHSIAGRLRAANPAVLGVLDRFSFDHGHEPSWEELISECLVEGATLSEIRAGGWIELLGFQARRHVESLLPMNSRRPSGPEWTAIVRAYRKVGQPRPTQAQVAEERGMAEETLKGRVRRLGIETWHDVHALVESEP